MTLDAELIQFKTLADWQKIASAIATLIGDIQPPSLVIAGSGAEQKLQFVPNKYSVLVLQNCGTTVIKWAINSPASADSFNGILAACTAVDDGLGSIVTIPAMYGGYVSLFSAGASKRLSTQLIYFNV